MKIKKFEVGKVYGWTDDVYEPFVVMRREEKTIYVVYEHNVLDRRFLAVEVKVKTRKGGTTKGYDGYEYFVDEEDKSIIASAEYDDSDYYEYYTDLTGLLPPRADISEPLRALRDLYQRTYYNCIFWEKEEKGKPVFTNLSEECWKDRDAGLNNEIGCLRGVAYCMEEIVGEGNLFNEIDHTSFKHFIDKAEELEKWKGAANE